MPGQWDDAVAHKLDYIRIYKNVCLRQRARQEKAIKGPDSTQCHIGLAERKCTSSHVHHNTVKCLALTTVNRKGVTQTQRKLRLGTDGLGSDAHAVIGSRVFVHLPDLLPNPDVFTGL